MQELSVNMYDTGTDTMGRACKKVKDSESEKRGGGQHVWLAAMKDMIGALLLPVGITHVGALQVSNEAVPDMWRAIGQ
jgi:hypothetical protein